jgi:hypothetical protein
MTREMHGDPIEPPVQEVARILLELSRQEPSLVGRSRALARDNTPRVPVFDLAALAGFTQIDLAQRMEDLTSIAMAAAQQAEEAFRQARETVRITRRNAVVFSLLGAVGILAAAASIADNHLSSPDLPATAVQAASTPPAVIGVSPKLEHLPATYVPPLPFPPTVTQPPSRHFVPPAYHRPPTFVAPWPSETVRIRRETIVERRRVALPPFVVAEGGG